MKKKARTLIILGAVLVVCIGAYIGVSVYNNAQAQKTADETKAAQIWSDGRGDPASIAYTAGDKTLSFTLEDGKWYVTDDRDFPLQQASLTNLATTVGSLSAVRTIDISSPLSVYGLDKPAYTVTAADAGGNTLTLLIGAENGGNYYAMAKDGNKIYTISDALVGDLKTDYLDMIALETIHSLSSTNVSAITVTAGGRSLKLDKHQNKDSTYTWFIVDGDTYTTADEFTTAATTDQSPQKYIDNAVTGLSSVSFSSCAAFKPTADDLKKFGLDAPQLTVNVDYADTTGTGTLDQATTTGTVSLLIGAALDDGSGYYAMLPGSSQVNVLPATAVTPLTDALAALGSGK
ncbi:protein of unknown function [Sporobacter termitidis DSM 10068]|uniref:DUF4340 domain-containing protein n=1 Tax=Sporobacter termitidis DSM 10068 TaxID=1123282 RepID=A0A1M5VPN5_9FIRM|nr:DUF4340 domain-containing protein [Sporobacter termitidis]SHH77195.1 protein of unknown function [Sporobacter termitidis DSM 10068]